MFGKGPKQPNSPKKTRNTQQAGDERHQEEIDGGVLLGSVDGGVSGVYDENRPSGASFSYASYQPHQSQNDGGQQSAQGSATNLTGQQGQRWANDASMGSESMRSDQYSPDSSSGVSDEDVESQTTGAPFMTQFAQFETVFSEVTKQAQALGSALDEARKAAGRDSEEPDSLTTSPENRLEQISQQIDEAGNQLDALASDWNAQVTADRSSRDRQERLLEQVGEQLSQIAGQIASLGQTASQTQSQDMQRITATLTAIQRAEKAHDAALSNVDVQLAEVATAQKHLSSAVSDMQRLYQNGYADTLNKLQARLDEYHKVDDGRVFDDILRSIADTYSRSEWLLDDVKNADPEIRKGVESLLESIMDVLDEHDVEHFRSTTGEKRKTLRTSVVKRVPTGETALHNTVAHSYNTGFTVGNRALVKERIDLYVYDAALAAQTETRRFTGASELDTETDSQPATEEQGTRSTPPIVAEHSMDVGKDVPATSTPVPALTKTEVEPTSFTSGANAD